MANNVKSCKKNDEKAQTVNFTASPQEPKSALKNTKTTLKNTKMAKTFKAPSGGF